MLLRRCLARATTNHAPILQLIRRFSPSARPAANPPLPPRPSVDEHEFTEVFLHGSGPGGQKINKTSSAVQLKHLPTGLVIKCQETRSRTQNRKIARRILAEKLEVLEKGDESRVAKKVERAKEKKARASKKTKRKYKRLAEAKDGARDDDGSSDAAVDSLVDSDEETGSIHGSHTISDVGGVEAGQHDALRHARRDSTRVRASDKMEGDEGAEQDMVRWKGNMNKKILLAKMEAQDASNDHDGVLESVQRQALDKSHSAR